MCHQVTYEAAEDESDEEELTLEAMASDMQQCDNEELTAPLACAERVSSV